MADWLTAQPIAHRGYHDLSKGRAENSMSAFRAAVDAGFAIECDVQVTKTGEPVVFHDPTLDRMTSVSGNLRDYTPQELEPNKLLDTTDGIYTLSQHLDAVAGRVPLVIEVKGVEGKDAGLVEGVAKSLKNYHGPVAVMSFDHWILAQFAKKMPDVRRGLTAEGGEETADTHRKALKQFDLQFVSYGVRDLPHPFVKEVREAGHPVITWTVKDPTAKALSDRFADQITFENFDPRELPDG